MTILHFPAPHLRSQRSVGAPGTLPSVSPIRLADYRRVSFYGGELVFGARRVALSGEAAAELAEVIHCAVMSSTEKHASRGEAPLAGVQVIAHGSRVELVAFGRQLSGRETTALVLALHRHHREESRV